MKSLTLPLTLCLFIAPAVAIAQGAPSTMSAEEALKARWQRQVREADEKVADAQHKLDTAKQALDVAAKQAILYTTGQNLAARAEAVEAEKRATAELAAAQKAKVDLLEQARRENVPPGYLR